jgi:short-subunit dehydrogenase
MNMKNQKIVIIGASSGIGFAIAKAALDVGANVVIISRNADKLQHAKTRRQLYI